MITNLNISVVSVSLASEKEYDIANLIEREVDKVLKETDADTLLSIPQFDLHKIVCAFNKEKDIEEISRKYIISGCRLADLTERRRQLGV